MEDDEEVVIKHSALYHHLRESGFEDFECTEAPKSSPGHSVEQNSVDRLHNEDYKRDKEENENFDSLVEIILNSNLVFEDDVGIVENFSIYHEKSQNFSRSLYLKLLSQTAATSSICLLRSFDGFKSKPLIYACLLLIPSGIWISKYLWRCYVKYKEKKLMKELIINMKDLSMMLQKCIQFIQESEILTYNSISRNKMKISFGNQSESNDYRWQIMFQLRSAVYNTLRLNILNLKMAICNLIKDFPLKKSVDELNFYLAFLSEEELHCSCKQEESISVDELQKMKYVYLLLQSEFLKRLCLNFNPSLWIRRFAGNDLFNLISNVKMIHAQQYSHIKEVFLIYYTFQKPELRKAPPNADWIYKEAYIKICSVSLNLQTVLKNSRNIEEFLENTRVTNHDYDNVISKLDNISEQLVNDYEYSKTVLEDFRKYVLHLKPKDTNKTSAAVPSNTELENTNKAAIFVGASDFRPPCPDEIFIGVSTQEKQIEAENLDDDFVVKNKCSKLLISELKLALQDKAQEWKERERIALKNQNLDDDLSAEDERKTMDDEMRKDEKKYMNSKKVRTRFISESSDDESSEDDVRPKAMIFPTGATFAEKIAQASSQWALETQDYTISDDEPDD